MKPQDDNRLAFTPSRFATTEQIQREKETAEFYREQGIASLGDFVSASIQEDQIASYVFADSEDFMPDQDWPNQLDETVFNELTADIPEDYHDFLEDTVSYSHAKAMRERVLKSVENEQAMASWGWSGIPMRIATNIADPFAIGATVVTEGVAAPLIWGAKATRIGRIVKGALAGAATNAAIEGYIASQSATRDEYDVLYATTAGLILGGGVGALPFKKFGKDGEAVKKAHENHLAAIEEAQAQDVINGIDGFRQLAGDKSVGAASNPLSPAPQMNPLRQGVDDLDDDITMQESLWDGTTRFDMTGSLLKSKNPVFNKLGQILGEDAVGYRDGGRANIEGTADLYKTNIMKGLFSRFYQTYNVEYKAWVKSETKGILRHYRLSNRAAFGELVADAIEKPDGVHHPAVMRMANKQRELYADLLKQAKESGVKGFEDIVGNPTYFTHRWNKFAFEDMRQKYGDVAVLGLLKQGLVQGSTDLSEDAAEQIAKVMYTKIRSDVAGIDSGFSRLFTADSRETLKQIMLEEKFGKQVGGQFKEFNESEVDSLLDLFKQKERGLPSAAKTRLRFDMDAKVGWGTETLSLKSLQERDAEQVFTMYTSEIAGRIALAKKGIKSETDFNSLLNQGASYAENEGGKLLQRAGKEAEVSQVMYNLIIGRRPHAKYDPNSSAMKVTRLVQDYNFLRLMGQVGWAQFAELGNAYNVAGFRGMIRAIPEFRNLIKRAKDGTLEDDVLRDIEAFYGTGSDRMINQMIRRLDYAETGNSVNGAYGTVGRVLNKAQIRTDQLKRVQADASGMAPITLMLERGTARIVSQTLADMAFASKSLSTKRLNSLGLGKQIINGEEVDFAELVYEQFRKHAKMEKSFLFKGKKLRALNLENWDVDAREAFGIALTRWTRRTIQQNDVGNLAMFMTTPWGQVLTQFRTFQMVSHSKQLLHGLAMNDVRGYLAMGISALTAGGAYMAQQNVKMIGMDAKERKEFAEERLSVEAIAKAGFSRSSWSAFIPSAIDTSVSHFLMDDPIFSYRTSGLNQSFLSGIPTAQAGIRAYESLGNLTRTISPFSDEEMTQGRARAGASLLPFQNVTGIGNAINYLTDPLPERSSR